MQLSAGTSGRLEIYKYHTWGAVCSNGFDTADATVACHQMGLYEGSVMPPNDYMIIESDDILLWGTSVDCDGNEESLLDCSSQWVDSYLGFNSSECTSGTYVAVICSENEQATTDVDTASDCASSGNCDKNVIATSDATYETSRLTESYSVNPQLNFVLKRAPIRLTGSTPYTGVVELYVENMWTTICDSYWNDNDATVVCRQLGFRSGNAIGI